MDTQEALNWISDVFAIEGRVLQITDTRASVPEWDSLGVLTLQMRLRADHGIVLGIDDVSKIERVQEICEILGEDRSLNPRHAPPMSTGVARRSSTNALNRWREKCFKLNFSNILRSPLASLSAEQKSTLRTLKKQLVTAFLSYTPERLVGAIRSIGVKEGDTVLLHSSFSYATGFLGAPDDVIDAFLESVGSGGNLMMLSLPYQSSTYEYLKSLEYFDVRKTVSQMGLVTEVFRERENVLRSLHPTHPILVCGPRAEWFALGHENSLYPCGRGTPFEKLAQIEGKILFYDAPFATLTFFHYLEDMVRHKLPFPLYHPEPFEVPVIDYEGRRITVSVYAFAPDAIKRRRPIQFESELRKAGLIRAKRIGNTRLQYVEAKPLTEFVNRMVDRGNLFFYDLS